jgi:GntR family transcriptional regulator
LVGVEIPKTRQVYLVLRELIASGKFRADAALPGEQALAAEHNVSRVTVRRALAGLEREGLIDRRRGAGTFVIESRAAKPMVVDLADVLSNLIAMGRSTDVRLLSFGYQDPSASVAEMLRLAEGERVQRSVRVRIIDGEPFSYLTTHVPERIGVTYSEPELASRPLLALLERSGVSVDHATQEISAVLAAPEVAAALNVDVGSALIALTRAVYDAQGRGVEHLHALYRPDRYALRMDLKRTGKSNGRRWAPLANGSPIAKIKTDVDATRLKTGRRRKRERKS